MASRKEHEFVTKTLFGKKYTWVDKFLDYPYKVLKGKHRMLFHDDFTAISLALAKRDPKVWAVAQLHRILDKIKR
jgi:hypothetical protein